MPTAGCSGKAGSESEQGLVQDGCVLLHIGGRLRVGGSGPLAMGPQGAGPPTAFAEAFVLQPGPGGGRVVRQFYRLMGPSVLP